MDPEQKIPQQQVKLQSAEPPRSEASANPAKNSVDKKPVQKQSSIIPRFGLPENYPQDDLFL